MEDMEEIRAEIELYKKWRNVLQFGDWYRLYEEADKNLFMTRMSLDGIWYLRIRAKP